MANFKTHFVTSTIVGGVICASLHKLLITQPNEAVLFLALFIIGGFLPDIDSERSITIKIVFDILAIVFAFLTIFAVGNKLSIIEILLLWFISFLFIKVIVTKIFTSNTVHRGVFHSIPSALFFATLSLNLLFYIFHFESSVAWIGSFMIFFGFLVHLILDELFSVNLFGTYIKKSLGSAIKVIDFNNISGTVRLYLLAFVLIFTAPKLDQTIEIFKTKNLYQNFEKSLMPKNGWFKDFFIFFENKS